MTRRQFLSAAAGASWLSAGNHRRLAVPVHQVVDTRSNWKPDQVRRFQTGIWSQAVRDLARCGVDLQTTVGTGEVWRYAYREPDILGLQCGVLNVVLTSEIPLTWDHGRALCGVTTRYRGRYLCMVALQHAHGHQVPFLSVNTCLHELLHALLQDIFETPRPGLRAEAREFRVDFYATRLWLFHDGEAIRTSARNYLERADGETYRARAEEHRQGREPMCR